MVTPIAQGQFAGRLSFRVTVQNVCRLLLGYVAKHSCSWAAYVCDVDFTDQRQRDDEMRFYATVRTTVQHLYSGVMKDRLYCCSM